MQIAPQKVDVVAGLGAVVVACALGAAVALGGLPVLGLLIAAVLAALGGAWALGQAMRVPSRVPLALAVVGVGLASANGVRVGQFTASDALLLASVPLSLLLLKRTPRPPRWFLAGAALVVVAAVVIEMFPPPTIASELFRQKNLTTGQVGQDSHLMLAARLLLAVAVVPFAVALAASTAQRARRLVDAWIIGTTLGAGVAVLAAFGPLDLQQTITGQAYSIEAYKLTQGRYTGLSVHPTLLGVAAAMVCPVVVGRMTTARRGWLYSPALAVLVLAVLVSGSRIALIAALAGVAVVFAYQHRARRQMLALAAGAVVLLAFTGSAASGLSTTQRLMKDAGGVQSAASSDAARSRTIREGVGLFERRPIGWGFQGLRGAHNVLVQILSGGGVLLLLGMGLIVGGAIVTGWKLRAEPDAVGVTAGLVVVLVSGLTTNAVFDRFLYIPVGLLLGLLVATRSGSRPARPTRSAAR